MELIQGYFPNLNDLQYKQLKALGELYSDWNAKINVISRKDMEHFYERHVLHSLAIAKVIQFKPDTQILDVGTGGGFPGIPLAILFPDVSFHLVDSIGKKIKVVQEVSNAIELTNLTAEHTRAEQVSGQFDFVVSRAVTRLAEFYPWVQNKFNKKSFNDLDNGILYLKGLDLMEEFDQLKKPYQLFSLKDYFTEEWFESKGVVFVPRF
ncbi:MAG: 16S rRNA (guanine(527)-N(7))-methyltransferase RsmG [Sphingobacteriaceae bacterium]